MGRVESDDLHISSTLTQKDFGIFGRGPEDKSWEMMLLII